MPWLRAACEEEAASPSSCAAEGSGGLLGRAWELRCEARFGVPETELRGLLGAGDDMTEMIVYVGALVKANVEG